MRPRSIDVARRANVSRTTVSYVLNNRRDVPIPEETRRRVWEAADALGYRVNRAARTLKTQRTQCVGFLTWGIFNAPSALALSEVYHCAAADGYEVLIHCTPQRIDADLIDGLIVHGLPTQVEQVHARPDLTGLPIVNFGHHISDSASAAVYLDLAPAASAAMEHLLAAGCQHIVHIVDKSQANNENDARTSAYKTKMREAGKQTESVVTEYLGRQTAYSTVKEYLAHRPCPDGWFCQNDEMALGVCHALREFGKRIGVDVAVTGCDDIEDARFQTEPLSTISIPYNALCKEAWRLLKSRLDLRPDTPELPREISTITPSFTVRASSQFRRDGIMG
jgi:LacI family transcriptional regulator